MDELIKVCAEFVNGDEKYFTDIDEENAVYEAICYAKNHNTEVTHCTIYVFDDEYTIYAFDNEFDLNENSDNFA